MSLADEQLTAIRERADRLTVILAEPELTDLRRLMAAAQSAADVPYLLADRDELAAQVATFTRALAIADENHRRLDVANQQLEAILGVLDSAPEPRPLVTDPADPWYGGLNGPQAAAVPAAPVPAPADDMAQPFRPEGVGVFCDMFDAMWFARCDADGWESESVITSDEAEQLRLRHIEQHHPQPDVVPVVETASTPDGTPRDVAKCPQCGQHSRSYSRGCSSCGYQRIVTQAGA